MTEFETADDVFIALGDATRRDILAQLRGGSARITEIAARYPLSLNAVSKHLKILERAGLISRTVAGREHWCSLDARPLQRVQRYLSQYESFWNERLDRLEATLAVHKVIRRAKQKTTRGGSNER
jgi:DNA-binding transcriptional ArsR family regulator